MSDEEKVEEAVEAAAEEVVEETPKKAKKAKKAKKGKKAVDALVEAEAEAEAAAPAKKKAKKKVTRKRKKTPTPEEAWEALKAETNLEQIKDYTMAATFEANTAIEHPKFGLGIVTLSSHTKIEVTFKDGPRNLVQNRT